MQTAEQTFAEYPEKEITLEFKYGTSRGQNSYGYRIVSLFAEGKKIASCNGGGYDMRGIESGKPNLGIMLSICNARTNGDYEFSCVELEFYQERPIVELIAAEKKRRRKAQRLNNVEVA